MDKYSIFVADEFYSDYGKLDASIRRQINKEIDQLETNPYSGKPLGYKFFREKKVRNYRIYYLVYEEYAVVFLIAISDKKNQQKIIGSIKNLLPMYKGEIKKKLNLS